MPAGGGSRIRKGFLLMVHSRFVSFPETGDRVEGKIRLQPGPLSIESRKTNSLTWIHVECAILRQFTTDHALPICLIGSMNTSYSYPTVVLASRNQKKSAEIRALLAPYGIPLLSVADFPSAQEVEEDGHTFQENAEKKASQTARALKHWAIGEDSGLQVDALGGGPGIYSARFSGPDATDDSNNALLIQKLQNIPATQRGAGYICHVAVADPDGRIRLNVEATCRGCIGEEPRGQNGFGYDPYFMIREYHRSFGELSPVVKQSLSHRARAFERLIPQLLKTLSESSV